MPRSVFNAVGGFDERYRLHAEDLDLCRRVRDAGHAVYVANRVRVLHLRGVSSRRRPWWVEWHKHRGIWRYLRRFDPQLRNPRSEEHTSELQSLMRISYAVFCLK